MVFASILFLFLFKMADAEHSKEARSYGTTNDMECAPIFFDVNPEIIPNARQNGNISISQNVSAPSRSHLRVSRTVETPYCPLCDIYFKFHKMYRQHFKETHDCKYPYVCHICHSQYEYKKALQHHSYAAHSDYVPKKKLNVSCLICAADCKGFMKLQEHGSKEHPGEKIIRCDRVGCDKTYVRVTSFYKHLRHEHSEINFQCKYCAKMCDTSEDVQSHAQECRKKHLELRMVNSDFRHVPETKPYHCYICKIPFMRLSQYAKHFTIVHPDRKLFPCRYCEKEFMRKQSLYEHMADKHEEEAEQDEDYQLRTVKRLLFTCPYCDLQISGVKNFENHGALMHHGKKLFFCIFCNRNECGAKFSSRKALIRHMRTAHTSVEM